MVHYAFFFLILILLGVWGMRELPGFLSMNTKTGTGYLVVDGHMPDYLIEAAIDIYATGNYKKVIVTGGALPSGYYISGVKNMAELSYKTFLVLEFDSTQIIVVPGGTSLKNRTYNSGLNLAAWFSAESNRFSSS